MKVKSIKLNFLWALIGNFAYGTGQWGVLIILAKLTPPDIVGRFSLAFAITAPVFMFTNLNLRVALATDAQNKYSLNQYLGLRIIMLVIAFCVMLAILSLTSYHGEVKAVILCVALSKIVEAYSDILYGFMQKHERMDIVAKSMVIKSILSLIFLAAGLYFTQNLLWGVIGLLVAWSLLLFIYDLPVTRMLVQSDASIVKNYLPGKSFLKPLFNVGTLKTLALISIPLGLTQLLGSLLTNIPRYFVEIHSGERELGIFAAIAYLIIVGGRVVTSLGESAIPRLSTFHLNKDFINLRRLLVKLFIFTALIGISQTILAAMAGPYILKILYNAEYAQNNTLFTWIMAAGGINYVALVLLFYLTAARVFKIQPLILFISGSSLAIMCAVLIPSLGVIGAAKALVLSSSLQCLMTLVIAIRVFSVAAVDTKHAYGN